MVPNDAGTMVQRVWDDMPRRYPGVGTDAFVVMPNHVHGIVWLGLGGDEHYSATENSMPDEGEYPVGTVGAGPSACPDRLNNSCGGGRPRGAAPTMSLPDVVHRFKSLTTHLYIRGVRNAGWPPFNGRLWQRNYYEHIIRNERNLYAVRRYIRDNPQQWGCDRNNPAGMTGAG